MAALLDPDPAVRHDGALSLMERLESSAEEDFGQATTRDGETFEIFQTLDPLPEAWQDIVSGHAELPKQERTGENISQSGEAGERTPSTTVVPQQPGAQQIDAPRAAASAEASARLRPVACRSSAPAQARPARR